MCLNHLPFTQSSGHEHWSISYTWSIANRVTENLSLYRHLLPSEFISASTQWWDRPGMYQSFQWFGVSPYCFPRWRRLARLLTVCQSSLESHPLRTLSVTSAGGTGEHVRRCLLTVPLAFLWRLAVLHAMTYTREHRAVSFCGITVQVLRSSKNQFIMVLLWRCLTSYKCRIIFTRWYTLRVFSPILWTRLSPLFVECFHWHAVAFGFHTLYLSAFCS